MESVKCEIRLLFIRQCSVREKEAVRSGIKQGESTSLIYSAVMWHLVKNDNNSLSNDNESNESLDTELHTRAQSSQWESRRERSSAQLRGGFQE